MDYLVELGRQSANTNVEVGARLGAVDDVFAGTANKNFNLGAESDIASGKLRYQDMPRTYNNLVGDFHVPAPSRIAWPSTWRRISCRRQQPGRRRRGRGRARQD